MLRPQAQPVSVLLIFFFFICFSQRVLTTYCEVGLALMLRSTPHGPHRAYEQICTERSQTAKKRTGWGSI